MKMRALFLMLLFSTCVAWGQNDKKYIEVIGSAEQEFVPNIIVVSVKLSEYVENKEKVALEKIEKEFFEAVGRSKIDKSSVEQSDLTIMALVQKRKDRSTLAQKTYHVTFSSSENLLTFLGNLENVSIAHLEIEKLSHTDIQKYILQIKIDALTAADKKAGALLAAVGVKKGKPIYIQEIPQSDLFDGRNFSQSLSNAYRPQNTDNATSNDTPLKKIKLRFEILARFEIE